MKTSVGNVKTAVLVFEKHGGEGWQPHHELKDDARIAVVRTVMIRTYSRTCRLQGAFKFFVKALIICSVMLFSLVLLYGNCQEKKGYIYG